MLRANIGNYVDVSVYGSCSIKIFREFDTDIEALWKRESVTSVAQTNIELPVFIPVAHGVIVVRSVVSLMSLRIMRPADHWLETKTR